MRTVLTTCDGIDLVGSLRLASDTPRAAVVLAHGFTASSRHPDLVRVADALHDQGYDVITYDARGHGDSGGECTLGDLEEHDVAAAVDAARRRCVPIVVVGASMGAIAVLRYAAHAPDVLGAVLVSSPARWRLPRNVRSVFAALLTRTAPGRALASRYLRVSLASRWTSAAPPLELVARVDGPVAVVHGAADRFIPVDAARELYAAATGPRRLTIVPGMAHAYEAKAVGPIVEAVEWVLATAVVPSRGG